MRKRSRTRPSLSAEVLAAMALALGYLAVASGHFASMDGLTMARQAYALAFTGSLRFPAALWTLQMEPVWNSMYGIGLSLLYIPGVLAAAALYSQVPASLERPAQLYPYYLQELYNDPLYTAGACWIHMLIVAAAAWFAGRLARALGCGRRTAMWAMVIYGVGSSASVYARGDFAQPLEGLCWAAALGLALAYRRNGSRQALAGTAAALGYAILTRPVEGVLLVPAALALAMQPGGFSARRLSQWPALVVPALGAAAGIAVTFLVNWTRFGDPLQFGYPDDNGWVVPQAQVFAAALVSPGRGLVWEFPAILLVPAGVMALVRSGRTRDAVAILALTAALFLNVTTWFIWWGGGCWGLRLFAPALPVLAALAAVGIDRLSARTRAWLPGTLVLAGFVWALPGMITDLLGGYAVMAYGTASAWRLAAYPPYGAWQFLHRVLPTGPGDLNAVDILWFRLARGTGYWSLLVPVACLAAAGVLARSSRRALRAETER